MNLGDILTTQGRAQPVHPHPVEFKAKGTNAELEIVTARVKAVLICLDEDQRTAARVAALGSVERRFKDKAVPSGVVSDEEIYHYLFEALRQPEMVDGIHPKLAATVMELRGALVKNEANRIYREYVEYMEREFPENVSDEKWAALVEDAKKNSIPDLLTLYGYGPVSRVLNFLAGLSSP